VNFQEQELGEFETVLFGQHNIENFVGAVAMSHLLGIEMDKVKEAVRSFKGVKVHLENRGKNSKNAVHDR